MAWWSSVGDVLPLGYSLVLWYFMTSYVPFGVWGMMLNSILSISDFLPFMRCRHNGRQESLSGSTLIAKVCVSQYLMALR